MKKRKQILFSGFDVLFNSLTTFIAFIFISRNFGFDIVGFFGLILSVCAFGETIQSGLYEKPAYLGFNSQIKGFKLNFIHLTLICFIPLLVIDRLIFSGHLITGLIFCISYLGIQNIRVADYFHQKIFISLLRSFIIFTIVIFSLFFSFYNENYLNLDQVLLLIALPRIFLVLINYSKLFSIVNTKPGNNLSMLLSSILTLIRSRLPLWALIPFGLGLVGIFESFRNIVEIYLTPSRPVFLVMINNLKSDGPKKIFKIGILFSILTTIFISFTYFYITELTIFNIPELKDKSTYFSLIVISICYWFSETTGMIFEFNSQFNFDVFRRTFSIVLYLIISLLFIKFLNFSYFINLVAFMYLTESFISYFGKSKLSINNY